MTHRCVILAEKPDQGRRLAAPFKHKKEQQKITILPCDLFPQGAVVVWAVGHLCELVDPEDYDSQWKKWRLERLPVIPDTFRHQVVAAKAAHFHRIKGHLRRAETIIIATDPAREGEYIARIIIQMAGAGTKTIKRLWCSSLTPAAIRKAFSRLRTDEESRPLYEEALARACSDWLVGINTSRVYTLLLQQKGVQGVFSTGRVQTPLLHLIRRREEEIERFKPEKYWELEATFETKEGERYKGKYSQRFFKGEQEKAKQMLQQIKGKPGIVTGVKTELKHQSPPLLHSLSTLQAKLNQRYKLPPAKVLQLLQSLYEKGYVSYPRTDSQHVTKEEAESFPAILQSLRQAYPIPDKIKDLRHNRRYVNEQKVQDHHAIIPTEQVPKLNQLSPEQRQVYDEVARSLIAAHYPDHQYNLTKVITQIATYDFHSTGKQVVQLGWKEVYIEISNQKKRQKEQKEEEQTLPPLSKGQSVAAFPALREGITKPPQPYTEGQLITLMRRAGQHIENEELVDPGVGLGTEATRAGMIQTLKERDYIKVTKNVVQVTPKGKLLCSVVRDSILAKPDLTAMWEKYLYEIGRGRKPAAPFIQRSKELASKLVQDAIRRSEHWVVPDSDLEQGRKNKGNLPLGPCPACGKGIVDRKTFYGCLGFQEGCRFTLPKKLLGKRISEAQVKRLLSKGITQLIKGFQSKKGTSFAAFLKLEKGKLQFVFPESQQDAKKKTGKTV